MYTTYPSGNPERNQYNELAEGIRRGCAISKPTKSSSPTAFYKITNANTGIVRTCVLGAACMGLGLMKGKQIDLVALRERFDGELLTNLEDRYERSTIRYNKRERLARWLERQTVRIHE